MGCGIKSSPGGAMDRERLALLGWIFYLIALTVIFMVAESFGEVIVGPHCALGLAVGMTMFFGFLMMRLESLACRAVRWLTKRIGQLKRLRKF